MCNFIYRNRAEKIETAQSPLNAVQCAPSAMVNLLHKPALLNRAELACTFASNRFQINNFTRDTSFPLSVAICVPEIC